MTRMAPLALASLVALAGCLEDQVGPAGAPGDVEGREGEGEGEGEAGEEPDRRPGEGGEGSEGGETIDGGEAVGEGVGEGEGEGEVGGEGQGEGEGVGEGEGEGEVGGEGQGEGVGEGEGEGEGEVGPEAPLMGVTGAWDFEEGDLSATVGEDLRYRGATEAQTAFGSTDDLGLPPIDGRPAKVMGFPRTSPAMGYVMPHGAEANGGGEAVNQYTLIFDVLFPAASDRSWRALFQTNQDNSNDGEFFVSPANGIGISSDYPGRIEPDRWHRVVVVVDLGLNDGHMRKHIDGELVGVQGLDGGLDGRFAVDPTVLVFSDDNDETNAGFVSSMQFRDYPMADADVAALGRPGADGVPLPRRPSLRVVSPNGGEVWAAGDGVEVRWETTHPLGSVGVSLLRPGGEPRFLGAASMRAGVLGWRVDPYLPDGDDYEVRLVALSAPGVLDLSDGPFSVEGSIGEPNARFGDDLLINGGFERGLQAWDLVDGDPTTPEEQDGVRAQAGDRFFHGGVDGAGDCRVEQDIDLLAEGFAAAELDAGAVLDASSFLRNWFGAGAFDDQVWMGVVHLAADGEPLSEVRTMIGGDDEWLRRTATGLLPRGTRSLRVYLEGRHRRGDDNDSMADDLHVGLDLPAYEQVRILKQPMLQDYRQDAMTLLWETNTNLATHAVEWGLEDPESNTTTRLTTTEVDTGHFVHQATLRPLAAETTYVYRVRSGDAVSPLYTFRTAPEGDTPFRVAWTSDNQNGAAVFTQLIAGLARRTPDLMISAGDVVQNGHSMNEWHHQWFVPLEESSFAQTTPILFARGNHDAEHFHSYAYSALPAQGSWYAFLYGNTYFVVLDTEGGATGFHGAEDQTAFLRRALDTQDAQEAAFRVVVFHKPPFSNLWDSPGYSGEQWVRQAWVPLMVDGGVDLVVCGHAHGYERGALDGITYLVVGGAGGHLDHVVMDNYDFIGIIESVHHYAVMDVDGAVMTWEVYDEDEALVDTFDLVSRTWDADGG